MPKITGRNALVYVGGIVLDTRNQVTISFTRELQEARVFSPFIPGGPWSDQIPGFRNYTININGYYNDASTTEFSSLTATDKQSWVVYESRTTLANYWYGNAFFNITEEIGVNDVVTVNLSGTGDSYLTRIPIP